ncbi:hypothetical protein QJS66_17115 [Kocuria rhizophila]|nr:hypothetical protein QJS66_17115 [Kocuria rhizophila]
MRPSTGGGPARRPPSASTAPAGRPCSPRAACVAGAEAVTCSVAPR